MALKGIYDNLDDAPEPLREHLVEREGKWTLDVDGYVTKETLSEFRTNNRSLNRDKEKLQKDWEASQAKLLDLEKRYEGVDPDEYKSLKAAPTDVQRQLAEVEMRLKAEFHASLEKERAGRLAAEQREQTEKIKSVVAQIGGKLGVLPTAMSNLQRDATEVMVLVDDAPIPHQKGEPRYSEKSPSKYMDVEEWITTLQPVHPEYFATSNGGGAGGGIGGQHRNGRAVVAASDQKAFLANLDGIAKGTIDVDMTA